MYVTSESNCDIKNTLNNIFFHELNCKFVTLNLEEENYHIQVTQIPSTFQRLGFPQQTFQRPGFSQKIPNDLIFNRLIFQRVNYQ